MSFVDPSFTRDPARPDEWLVHGPAAVIRRHAADGTPLPVRRADGSVSHVLVVGIRTEASADFTNHPPLPPGRL